MKLLLEFWDVDLWDIIRTGSFIPKKKNQARIEIDKPKTKWTFDERAKVLLKL